MELTKDNLKLMAAKCYRVPRLDDKEFTSDLSLVTRILNRFEEYQGTGEIQINKVVNQFLISCNCFGHEFVVKAMFLRAKETLYPTIISFLQGIGFEDERVVVNSRLVVKVLDYPADQGIQNRIKEALGDI